MEEKDKEEKDKQKIKGKRLIEKKNQEKTKKEKKKKKLKSKKYKAKHEEKNVRIKRVIKRKKVDGKYVNVKKSTIVKEKIIDEQADEKNKKKLIWNVSLIVVIFAFIFSSYNLILIYLDYKNIKEENDSIVNDFTYFEDEEFDNEVQNEIDTISNTIENSINSMENIKNKKSGLKVKWDELKEINKDALAWIYIPGTNINYPVVQSDIGDKYLKTNIYGEFSNAGSIFVDSNTIYPFNVKNTIIYGHNLNSGDMFSNIKKYQNESYAKDNNEIKIILDDNSVKTYKIFAFYETDYDNLEVYNTNVIDLNGYYSSIEKHNTLKNLEIPDKTKEIITLSTCTNYNDKKRFVLHAFLVD